MKQIPKVGDVVTVFVKNAKSRGYRKVKRRVFSVEKEPTVFVISERDWKRTQGKRAFYPVSHGFKLSEVEDSK